MMIGGWLQHVVPQGAVPGQPPFNVQQGLAIAAGQTLNVDLTAYCAGWNRDPHRAHTTATQVPPDIVPGQVFSLQLPAAGGAQQQVQMQQMQMQMQQIHQIQMQMQMQMQMMLTCALRKECAIPGERAGIIACFGEHDSEVLKQEVVEAPKKVVEPGRMPTDTIGQPVVLREQLAALEKEKQRLMEEVRSTAQRMARLKQTIMQQHKMNTVEPVHKQQQLHRVEHERAPTTPTVHENEQVEAKRVNHAGTMKRVSQQRAATCNCEAEVEQCQHKRQDKQQPETNKKRKIVPASALIAAAEESSPSSGKIPRGVGALGQWQAGNRKSNMQQLYCMMHEHGAGADFCVDKAEVVADWVQENFHTARNRSVLYNSTNNPTLRAKLVALLKMEIPKQLARVAAGEVVHPRVMLRRNGPANVWIKAWVKKNRKLFPVEGGFKAHHESDPSAAEYQISQRNCLDRLFNDVRGSDAEKELSALRNYDLALDREAKDAGQTYLSTCEKVDGSARHWVAKKLTQMIVREQV